MWKHHAAAATLALLMASPAMALEHDIFAGPAAPAGSVDAAIDDVRLAKPDARKALRRALTTGRRELEDLRRGWAFLCDDDFHRGRYAAAISDCTAAKAHGAEDRIPLMRALRGTPAPAFAGGATMPFDADGRIPVKVGDVTVAAFADTGAQVAVLMESVAQAGGARFVGYSGSVGTTTAAAQGRYAVVPRLTIGNAVITNVPALVLPDAALTYEGGKFSVPCLLSLYAMWPAGRIAWLDHGKTFVIGTAAPAAGPDAVPVALHPLGIAVPLDGPGGRRAAHFDTGNNKTYLYDSGLALVAEGERAALVDTARRVGGVGGVVSEPVRRLPLATLTLAGQPIPFHDIDVAKQSPSGESARLGGDIFRQFEQIVLDFNAMRFAIQP
jgi:hypothetical protein